MAEAERYESAGLSACATVGDTHFREPHTAVVGGRRKLRCRLTISGSWICESPSRGVRGLYVAGGSRELAYCLGMGEVVGLDARHR